jgi:hypothetical protein
MEKHLGQNQVVNFNSGAQWLNPLGTPFFSNMFSLPSMSSSAHAMLALIGVKKRIAQDLRRFCGMEEKFTQRNIT